MFTIDKSKLKNLLIERGMSYADLARKAEISKTQIWRIFKYDSSRNIKTVSKICKALNVTQNEILQKEGVVN